MIDRIPTSVRKIAPCILCLMILLFSQMINARFVCIPLVFVPIFYFALFHTHVLNAYACFGLGLFTDLIYQIPFGLSSFIFVLMFFITRINRPLLREFSERGLWLFFAFITALLLLIQLFFFTITEGSVIHTKFLFEQFVVVILLYPLLMRVCDSLNEWIGDAP